jgi:hypothetical protein
MSENWSLEKQKKIKNERKLKKKMFLHQKERHQDLIITRFITILSQKNLNHIIIKK